MGQRRTSSYDSPADRRDVRDVHKEAVGTIDSGTSFGARRVAARDWKARDPEKTSGPHWEASMGEMPQAQGNKGGSKGKGQGDMPAAAVTAARESAARHVVPLTDPGPQRTGPGEEPEATGDRWPGGWSRRSWSDQSSGRNSGSRDSHGNFDWTPARGSDEHAEREFAADFWKGQWAYQRYNEYRQWGSQ